jgi:excisionase family DNA binding protein
VEDRSGGEGVQKVSVAEACELLGISDGAVRKRIARGTLKTERDGEGRVFVLLPDREAAGRDAGQPGGQGTQDPDALLNSYKERVEDLKEQLAAEREANRENRRIIAGLTQRIPELMPASDERGQEDAPWPDREPDGQDESGTRPGRQEAAEGPQTRPWWRRVFGG